MILQCVRFYNYVIVILGSCVRNLGVYLLGGRIEWKLQGIFPLNPPMSNPLSLSMLKIFMI
jgi:hypothetical protein